MNDFDLLQLIKEGKYLEDQDLDAVLEEARSDGVTFGFKLVEKDLISDDNLGRLVADHLKMRFVELSKVVIDKKYLNILPESVAEKNKAIVFDAGEDMVKVATCLPDNRIFLEMLKHKIGKDLDVFYATERDMESALRNYKKELQVVFEDIFKNGTESKDTTDSFVTNLVRMLIEYAYKDNASDIHIEPEEEYSIVRFRIDGILSDVLKVPKAYHQQVVTKIKVDSKLRTDEHLSAQDGKMQYLIGSEDLDIRVSIVPVTDGEKVVMRLLSENNRQFSLADLGMSQSDLEKVKNGFEKPYGMILSTGPTGSGKTTTVYAILKILNTRDRNISTIEDPVEYEVEGINQIQVNTKTNLTFANGLRSILRQDPDTIFVGEIRDSETAGIAINSAMTGHLVLSTLHTNNSATTLPRLIDMEIEPFLVSSTVNVIVGQRLVRTICEKCKVSVDKTKKELQEKFNETDVVKVFGKTTKIRVYKGKGCPVCHMSGYVGRVGVFEVLEVNDEIRDLVNKKADADLITQKAVEMGMTTMLQDGLLKVQNGLTTIEEVLRVTKE